MQLCEPIIVHLCVCVSYVAVTGVQKSRDLDSSSWLRSVDLHHDASRRRTRSRIIIAITIVVVVVDERRALQIAPPALDCVCSSMACDASNGWSPPTTSDLTGGFAEPASQSASQPGNWRDSDRCERWWPLSALIFANGLGLDKLANKLGGRNDKTQPEHLPFARCDRCALIQIL